MKSVLIPTRPQWCEKICHEIGKDETGKSIYEKRIEVRKSAPKAVPFKAYIYATKAKKFYKCGAVSTSDELLWLANGKVEMGDGFKFWADGDEYQCLNGRIIGEFICDKIDKYTFSHYEAEYRVTHVEQNAMCLNQPELIHYGKGKTLYGWHISDLKIYDKPRELSDFLKPCPDTFHYCTICKHCVKIIPPDEEEYALYHGGQYDYWEEHCTNRLTSPPQSWRYVEDLREE